MVTSNKQTAVIRQKKINKQQCRENFFALPNLYVTTYKQYHIRSYNNNKKNVRKNF